MPNSKVTGTPVHPRLCALEKVSLGKPRTDLQTSQGAETHARLQDSFYYVPGLYSCLNFFPAGRLQVPCVFSAPTLGLILSYNPLGLDKLSKFTFYGECWNVPSSFYSYKTKVGRETWPVFLDLPPPLASEFFEGFPAPTSLSKPRKNFQRPYRHFQMS